MKRFVCKILLLLVILFAGGQGEKAISCPSLQTEECSYGAIKDKPSAGWDEVVQASLDQSHSLFISFRNNTGSSLQGEMVKRVQRNVEREENFYLRLLLFYCSLREVGLSTDRERLFPSTSFHCVVPSCAYYVFALRKIII